MAVPTLQRCLGQVCNRKRHSAQHPQRKKSIGVLCTTATCSQRRREWERSKCRTLKPGVSTWSRCGSTAA